MPTFIKAPQTIMAVGNKPKRIEEFVGRVNTKDENVSVARMVSPGGWFIARTTERCQPCRLTARSIVTVRLHAVVAQYRELFQCTTAWAGACV